MNAFTKLCIPINRLGDCHGCITTKPGLAPKRLICTWIADAIDSTTFDSFVKNPSGSEEIMHRTPQEKLAVWALAPVISMGLRDRTGASAQTANFGMPAAIRGML